MKLGNNNFVVDSKRASLPSVSVIVLNYNGGKLLLDCLASVMKTDYPSFDLIVVDNASTDGSMQAAEQMLTHEPVSFIENKENLGYCVGNNIGLKRAKGDYFVLLNPDTVVTVQWLSELLKEAVKHGDGLYNPKILRLGNAAIIDGAGNDLHLSGMGLAKGLGQRDVGQYDSFQEIGYANGTCLLLSKKVLCEIGFLEPYFFAYGEDVDWGWRARMLGISSYCVPTSIVYHKWGAIWGRTNKKKLYLVERNRMIALVKNYSLNSLVVLSPILLSVDLAVLFFAFQGKWLSHKILAYADLIRLRRQIMDGRKVAQKTRRVSDAEVIRVFNDEINHPLLSSPLIGLFNSLLKPYIRIARRTIK